MKTSLVSCCRAALAVGALTSLIAAAPAAADWTGPVEISDAGSRNASNLQVDADTAGTSVAAWQYGSSGVAVAVSPAVGGPLAPQKYAGSYGPPTVGVGGGDVGTLAFESTAGGSSYAIYAASKPGGSGLFGSATAIYGPGTESATGHPILSVNDQGTAQLFHDVGNYQYCCTHSLVGRLLTDPGENTWSTGSTFSSVQSETHNRAVGTAVDGSTVLLYKTNNGLNFREIIPAVIENDGTVSRGAAIDASSGNGGGALSNPSGISVARMPDASVVAAMGRIAGTGGGIWVADFSKARASGASGAAPTESRVSADEDGSQPQVATDAAGNSLVTWYDPSDGTGDPNAIRARFRPAGSSTWGAVETVATGNLGAHELSVDDLGNAFLVYLDEDADAIVSRVRRPGAAGAWNGLQTLSTGLSGVEDPQVAVGDDNEAFAAFTADNGAGAPARAVYSAVGDATPKACEDGVDNDGDGLVDYPADPGCSSAVDDDESNPPADDEGGGGGSSGAASIPADTRMATADCKKSSSKLANTTKRFKKAKRKLKKSKALYRKTKDRRAKAQFKKAQVRVKRAQKRSKKARRARRMACG